MGRVVGRDGFGTDSLIRQLAEAPQKKSYKVKEAFIAEASFTLLRI